MPERVKVTVVGSGYVGMSLAVLLAQQNDVTVLDIDSERVDKVNRRESTVADPDIEAFERPSAQFVSDARPCGGVLRCGFCGGGNAYQLRPRH